MGYLSLMLAFKSNHAEVFDVESPECSQFELSTLEVRKNTKKNKTTNLSLWGLAAKVTRSHRLYIYMWLKSRPLCHTSYRYFLISAPVIIKYLSHLIRSFYGIRHKKQLGLFVSKAMTQVAVLTVGYFVIETGNLGCLVVNHDLKFWSLLWWNLLVTH